MQREMRDNLRKAQAIPPEGVLVLASRKPTNGIAWQIARNQILVNRHPLSVDGLLQMEPADDSRWLVPLVNLTLEQASFAVLPANRILVQLGLRCQQLQLWSI